MAKNEAKKRLLKITLTASWRGEHVRETRSMSMGMLSEMKPKTIREMVREMRAKYWEQMEAESCLHPDMQLTVRSRVTALDVDFFLNV